MEGGAVCFRGSTPFIIQIQGSINGINFRIEGKGTGDARAGRTTGKFVCTTGKLPISWAAMAGTLGYGNKCYAKYPNGVLHFFQECMPEGYVQERVTRYHDDGTLKTYHEVTCHMGVIMNKVTVQGEGFRGDSPLLNNGVKCYLPNTENTYPYGNGIRSLAHHVFPLKTTAGGGYMVAIETTVNKPLGNGRNIVQPNFHFATNEIMHSTDVDDERDHIIHSEIIEGFEMKPLKSYD